MKKIFLLGLVMGVLAMTGCPKADVVDVEGTFSFKVGQFEVIMLVEAERDGNTGILIDADEEVLEQYIPADGFRHTANAFLVKTGIQNILIDTGTGADGIIVEKLIKLGVQPEEINAVLITHLHFDHFGGLTKDGEAVFPNASVYLSRPELEYFGITNVNERAVEALAPYDLQLVTFFPDELETFEKTELLPGITPIAAFGHTPGHTLYQIENGSEKLLIIGDLLHVALVQFAIPEISATFDIDPAEAAVTRRQVLSYAAENGIPVGGMHIVNPGIGRVEIDGEGFKFTPVN